MSEYNPIKTEEKWRKIWEEKNANKIGIKKAKKPYYNLMMFPYPSAEGLHIGNVYASTGSDIHGRYMRMRGYDVFEPMGFDAFGIHSENFAIKQGTHPREETAKNVSHFRDQFKHMGALFDWDHEVDTSNPNYYKWTQWLFLQLYKQGLAYRAKAPVDWCPGCKTVLANEQVINGKCERCDSEVTQKELEQWFLKITKYAEKLLNNLDEIDWSSVVKIAQKNWIGRSTGVELQFKIKNKNEKGKITDKNSKLINVFTTRPDTLFGSTYVVLSPEHDLVEELKDKIENWYEVYEYIAVSNKKTELERTDLAKDKTGVELKGIKAINPANNKEIPVWIADYVLKSYGTGAIMAVPAHDQRDFEFAKKYSLPIEMVICPNYPDPICPVLDEASKDEGYLVASGDFTGMPSLEAGDKITKFVGGERKVNYHLRDWLISRQRYWGPPIPMIYCDKCGVVPVPEEDLPVELPYVEDFRPKGTDKSPLAAIEEFVKTKCPKCDGDARRETDVSDTFLDSSWYFLRYPSTEFDDKPFDKTITKKWLPVDMYIGGKEHSVLHLMYARFVTMALYDAGLIDFKEPFDKFRAHGLLIREGAKMSKSRGNVIGPDEYFESYGADALRMYLMFLGPYEQGGDWQDQGIAGISRFLKKVWTLCQNSALAKATAGRQKSTSDELERLTHKTIKKVTEDIESLQYNTAISALMEFVNEIKKDELTTNYKLQAIRSLLVLLAPLAPHISEELWEQFGHKTSVHDESWPEYDPEKIKEDKVSMAIQINGKVRSQIETDIDASQESIKEMALGDEKIKKWLEGKTPNKIIVVPNKVVNIVI